MMMTRCFSRKSIDRRQERVADRLLFAGRVEQFQQRRQHRDAGEERDQHADAGDLAEFGDALVVGRQEAEEAGRRRHRRERERHRGALAPRSPAPACRSSFLKRSER